MGKVTKATLAVAAPDLTPMCAFQCGVLLSLSPTSTYIHPGDCSWGSNSVSRSISYANQWMLQPSPNLPTTHSVLIYISEDCSSVRVNLSSPYQAHPHPCFLHMTVYAADWPGMSHIPFGFYTYQWVLQPISVQPTPLSCPLLCWRVLLPVQPKYTPSLGPHTHW